MNKKINILILLVLVLISMGCSDTLGTDPKVKKTKLNEEDSKFLIEDIGYKFSELAKGLVSNIHYYWNDNDLTFNNFEIMMDTSQKADYLWIDLNVTNEMSNNYDELITGIRMDLDSVVLLSGVEMTGDIAANQSVEVEIWHKSNDTKEFFDLSPEEVRISFLEYPDYIDANITFYCERFTKYDYHEFTMTIVIGK